jgi:hypothetical protein
VGLWLQLLYATHVPTCSSFKLNGLSHRANVAIHPAAASAVATAGGAHPGAVAKAAPNYLARAGAAAAAAAASDSEVLQRQYNFVRWLSQTLMDSLYPGVWQSVLLFASNNTSEHSP